MNKKLFIMGSPGAGKSTFLAALWNQVFQREIPMGLTLKTMTGDQQYLHTLKKKWLDIERLERTAIGQEKMELSLLLSDGKEDFVLEFPDLSGETFQNIYETREMNKELYELILNSDALLYFVNIENIHSAEFIAELSQDLRSEETEMQERQPCKDDPTQVQMIDLLQIIAEIKQQKMKLGIVLSAWDLVKEHLSENPKQYLKKHMNMLWQFLKANREKFDTCIWGVSAQGGKIEDVDILVELEPINRVIVVREEQEVTNDLTSIISEMLGGLKDDEENEN